MKSVLHKADTRGRANHGWLDSHHTFSFSSYHDPERMHFGMLRVLNDDVVRGGMGFGRHPHDNMEIVSIPLKGSLEHQDNSGGHGIIRSGEVQIMSAGSGIEHSEKNASATDTVNFLQIWVFPKQRDIVPRYDQKEFQMADRLNKIQTVVSPEKGSPALWINQDAWFHLVNLKKDKELDYVIRRPGNGLYAFVISGGVKLEGTKLGNRDGQGVWETEKVGLNADADSELLLMDVPMS